MKAGEPSLPPELTDEIIGWIAASKNPRRHLSSCSLVCKGWLSASRSHLFHSIEITPHNATQWKQLLQAPDLTPYLRHVEILERSISPWIARPHMESFYDLLSYTAPLSTVTSICIDALPWGRPHFGTLFTTFRNITNLTIMEILLRDNLQLMQILPRFVYLQELSLARVRVHALLPIPDSGPMSGHLHLELRDMPAAELAFMGLLMRHLHEYLRTLVLSFASFVDFTSLPAHSQPHYNPNLRHVHLILDLTLFSVTQPLNNHQFFWE
ncbi:hypothetical protein C8R44DRAFT_144862 [Mycena epipterygia]|nr:hypothetical protein C8R44DRAFT_144862 [Mycena epipterygia]